MKQPKKDVLRERIRQLNIDLNNLRAENEYRRRPWWRRIFRARAA
jgi:hypothetical protein